MYKVTKRDCPMFGIGPYVCEFICDTASDITTLPTSISEGTGGKTAYDNQKCASGSIANVAENGAESKQYMLNNQNIWCPYSVVSGSSDSVLEEAKAYTDSEIADLINGAPTTRDTLKEIADAMAENQTVVEALDAAIGTKANKTDIPTKTSELENDSGFLSEHQDLSGYAKKTDIPTALPADGGNADTIANVPINDIFISKTLQGIPNIDNTDGNWSVGIVPSWDSALGTFPDNCPSWVVINQYKIPGEHFLIQICYGVDANRIWVRSKHALHDSWGNWKDVYSLDNKPYVTGEIAFANQNGNSYTSSPVPTNHGFMPSKVLYWELPNDVMKEPYQVYSATSFDENSFIPYSQYGASGAEDLPDVKPSYRYGYIIFK